MKKTVFYSALMLFTIGLINAQPLSNSSFRFSFENPVIKLGSKSNETYSEKIPLQHSNGSEYVKINEIHERIFQNNRKHSPKSSTKSNLDNKQRLDSLMMQIWDESTKQWVFISRGEYTYNEMGNLTQFVSYARSQDLISWIASGKAIWTYDVYGNMTGETDFVWDEFTSHWLGIYKYEFGYDANGNQNQFFGYYFSDSSQQWVYDSKIEYTYDTTGNLTQEFAWTYNGYTNQWVNRYKCEDTYDAYNNLTQKIYSF